MVHPIVSRGASCQLFDKSKLIGALSTWLTPCFRSGILGLHTRLIELIGNFAIWIHSMSGCPWMTLIYCKSGQINLEFHDPGTLFAKLYAITRFLLQFHYHPLSQTWVKCRKFLAVYVNSGNLTLLHYSGKYRLAPAITLLGGCVGSDHWGVIRLQTLGHILSRRAWWQEVYLTSGTRDGILLLT